MANNKTHLLIPLLFAAIFFATPIASAATNAPADKGGESETDNEHTGDRIQIGDKPFWELLGSGGIMMVPLALLALFAFYKSGEQIYVFKFSNGDEKDRRLLDQLLQELDWDKREGIIDGHIVEHGEKAAFPQMCREAVNKLLKGHSAQTDGERLKAMKEAYVNEGKLQLGRLKRGIKPLQGVVTVAPLLGLLGTVYGMISSFQSMGSEGEDKVAFLSEGIYEALVTTATGLTIAIPFLFLSLWFNRKADELGEKLNRHGQEFL